MSYIVYLFNNALQYSYVALAMLPSASGSVGIRGTQRRTTRLRGSRIEGYNPNPGEFGGLRPPHRDRAWYIWKNWGI